MLVHAHPFIPATMQGIVLCLNVVAVFDRIFTNCYSSAYSVTFHVRSYCIFRDIKVFHDILHQGESGILTGRFSNRSPGPFSNR